MTITYPEKIIRYYTMAEANLILNEAQDDPDEIIHFYGFTFALALMRKMPERMPEFLEAYAQFIPDFNDNVFGLVDWVLEKENELPV